MTGVRAVRLPTRRRGYAAAGRGPAGRPRHAAAVAMDVPGAGFAGAAGACWRASVLRCECVRAQAMVHELLSIDNNRVDLRSLGNKIAKENQELVLSAEQDAFFHAQMFANYGALLRRLRMCARARADDASVTRVREGDLGVAIKGMVDEFQAASKSNQKIQTIADMQRFVENYPEFRAKSGNVSKHVTLMGEMSRLIDERHLMKVSQVEQATTRRARSVHACADECDTGPCMRHLGPHRRFCVRHGAAGEPRGAQASSVHAGARTRRAADALHAPDPCCREAAPRPLVRAALRTRRASAGWPVAGDAGHGGQDHLGTGCRLVLGLVKWLTPRHVQRRWSMASWPWHVRASAQATCLVTRTSSRVPQRSWAASRRVAHCTAAVGAAADRSRSTGR